jgi:Domain of unknown function (DUF1905)
VRTPPKSECEVLSHGRVRWQRHRVEVPAAVVNALGSGRRPEVVITIGGHTWRSRVASMGGRFIVGISAANRAASGITEGDVVEVGLRLDAEPRVVAEPPDLADALDRAPQACPGPRETPGGVRRCHTLAGRW